MDCCCKSGKTINLKLEGDIGSDPIWCKLCGCNLDSEDLPISKELANKLTNWAFQYGEWIDWETDKLLPHASEREKQFNENGLILTEKLKRELGVSYAVDYVPSLTVKMYERIKG
ncbi:hypothetical protein [Virgibacillus proomii]|jgi:hypothetical protein|uniref:hypothetical protein n=1 Tax=Virgibacillus proomii TaxID=84407 RepID=UPI0009873E3A|nr:hypothetical protein [Virgibacillus proomii]